MTNDIKWLDLTLEAENMRNEKADLINGLISIGKPTILDAFELASANKKGLESELVVMQNDYNFYYCRIPLSIRPGDKHDVQFLALDIFLDSPGSEALCWSMMPMKVEKEFKVVSEAKMTGNLTLEFMGLDASKTKGTEFIEYQPTIEAFGIGEANPAWELRAVKGKKLSGIQLFYLTLQVPKQKATTLRIQIKADILKKGFIMSYKAYNAEKAKELYSMEINANKAQKSTGTPTKDLADTISRIRQSLVNGQISAAIEDCVDMAMKGGIYYNDAIILATRFKILRDSISSGTVSKENETLEQNKITASILELVDKFSL